MISVADRRHLILHLDAPLMAFGAPIVDQHGETGDVPLPSMIAGLLGNALGYRRVEAGFRIGWYWRPAGTAQAKGFAIFRPRR